MGANDGLLPSWHHRMWVYLLPSRTDVPEWSLYFVPVLADVPERELSMFAEPRPVPGPEFDVLRQQLLRWGLRLRALQELWGWYSLLLRSECYLLCIHTGRILRLLLSSEWCRDHPDYEDTGDESSRTALAGNSM